jgi:hypothetical protein
MQIVVEDDPTPLVLIMGTTLRRSTSDPAVALKAQRLHGVFAVRSKNDPQAVTMRFADGRLELTHGVARDAQVVATVDLDNMTGPNAAKPKVKGALFHPFFALGVSKLLEPAERPWTDWAADFWAFAADYPGMPDVLRVTCLDDGAQLELGAGSSLYEIHGTAPELTSIFSGGSVFGQDLLDGKVFAVGEMKHASILTGQSLEWTMRGPS